MKGMARRGLKRWLLRSKNGGDQHPSRTTRTANSPPVVVRTPQISERLHISSDRRRCTNDTKHVAQNPM